MDFRLLARSLRARPTPWLQQQTQLYRVASLANGVRYNSSHSSPSIPDGPPAQPPSPSKPRSRAHKLPPKLPAPQSPPRQLSRTGSWGRVGLRALGGALRKLQATLSQNRVRHDAHEQKFHVRKGMVRKQKKMERWKKLFKFSFQGTVKKIQRMQAQGW
ncbi:hypothetical protein PDIDSM_4184 [Penicillium digitatum]|nr:hypothetical protein PDIDSM_4184 [Penicillium digitatum]